MELLAEVAQPIAGELRRTDRARRRAALQPEHRRKLSEIVPGFDSRERFLDPVVARAEHLDATGFDDVHEVTAIALPEDELRVLEHEGLGLARRGVGARR